MVQLLSKRKYLHLLDLRPGLTESTCLPPLEPLAFAGYETKPLAYDDDLLSVLP